MPPPQEDALTAAGTKTIPASDAPTANALTAMGAATQAQDDHDHDHLTQDAQTAAGAPTMGDSADNHDDDAIPKLEDLGNAAAPLPSNQGQEHPVMM
jgi:hypothetical protein